MAYENVGTNRKKLSGNYRFGCRFNVALVGLVRYGSVDQTWSRGVIAGRDKYCIITGKTIARGAVAWRPVTHADNRMHRMSEEGLKLLEQQK